MTNSDYEALYNKQRNVLQCIREQIDSLPILDKSIVHEAVCSSDEEERMKQIRLRVMVGKDAEGNAIVKRVGAYDELSLADKIVEAMIESGRINEFLQKPIKPPKKRTFTSFADYADHWLTTYKCGVAKTTQVFYNSKVNVLKRHFENKPIEEIATSDVQGFVTARAEKYSKKTVHDDLAVLKELLDSAVSDGIIQTNPARDKRVKNNAQAGEGTAALTKGQISSIQKAIPGLEDSNEKCLIALLAYTSMRREEVLGLRWECVNFNLHKIEIREATVYVGSKTHIKGTKTAGSMREFPMCSYLEDILRDCSKPCGYVVAGKNGKPLTHWEYLRLWDSLSQHIELYGMTAINFRTTFATMAVASGVDVRTTQSLMGHTTPEMTLKIYTKQEQSRLDDAMNQVTSFVSAET